MRARVIALLLLTSCSLVPEFTAPPAPKSASWVNEDTDSKEARLNEIAQFWQATQNPELQQLIEAALRDNPDLAAALARIDQARAQEKITSATLWPALNGNGSLSRDRSDPGPGAASTTDSGTIGVGLSYELDLFGRLRAQSASAGWQFVASQYDFDALKLVTLAQVARSYVQVLALHDRMQVANDNLKNARDILKITTSRFEIGTESGLELAQQRAALATTEAGLASLGQQLASAHNALALLLGRAPASLQLSGNSLDNLALPVVATLQPAALLARRPDIAKAEADLRSAGATIGAARGAFFPTLNLALDGALIANPLGSALGTLASGAAGLAAPIFRGGALDGGVELSEAQQAALVAAYRKTILTSYQETENALAALRAAQTRQTTLAVGVAQTQEAYRIARARYEAGAIDFLNFLNTQAQLLSAQDSLVLARQDYLLAAIDLYKAMGGGWEISTATGTGVKL